MTVLFVITNTLFRVNFIFSRKVYKGCHDMTQKSICSNVLQLLLLEKMITGFIFGF